MIRILTSALGFAVLVGCMTPTDEPSGSVPALVSAQIPPPEGAPEDSCWVSDVTPAVIETVTAQVEVSPAFLDAVGETIQPAIYQTETRQQIVKERGELIFQTPCPDQITPEFTANLQRALLARGLYQGPVTSDLDAATGAAVRRYQEPRGLASAIISLESARALGLIAIERPVEE